MIFFADDQIFEYQIQLLTKHWNIVVSWIIHRYMNILSIASALFIETKNWETFGVSE